ncbi:MAG: hypothetical protein R3C05_17015 [Pirellulaceae bacterium]
MAIRRDDWKSVLSKCDADSVVMEACGRLEWSNDLMHSRCLSLKSRSVTLDTRQRETKMLN